MKQRLGKNKHRRCEALGGRAYTVCYVRGSWPHGQAECWFGEGHKANADIVNYLTGDGPVPTCRDGKFV